MAGDSELLNWLDVDGFRYSGTKTSDPLHPDIHFSSYLATLDDVNDLDQDVLHRNRVSAISITTGEKIDAWPIYRCIYAEVEHGGATYLLNSGQWYQIDRDFVQ